MPDKESFTEEEKKIMSILRSNFRLFVAKDETVEGKIGAYAKGLAGVPEDVVRQAMASVALEQEYFPSFAALYKACQSVAFESVAKGLGIQILDEYDAWKVCAEWVSTHKGIAKNPLVEIAIRKFGRNRLDYYSEKDLRFCAKDFAEAYRYVLGKCMKFALDKITGKGELEREYDFFAVKQEIDAEEKADAARKEEESRAEIEEAKQGKRKRTAAERKALREELAKLRSKA